MHTTQYPRILIALFVAATACLLASTPAEAAKKKCSSAERQVVEIVALEIDQSCPCDRRYESHDQYTNCVAETSDFLFRMAGVGETCQRSLKAGGPATTCSFGESVADAEASIGDEL